MAINFFKAMPDINIKIENPSIEQVPEDAKAHVERLANYSSGFERIQEKAEEKKSFAEGSLPAFSANVSGVNAQKKELTTANIEKALSNDLVDVYLQMTPAQQIEFKQQGEQTAREIKTLLSKTKVNVKKITKIILNWLKMIPGINKFFLEQEAKIKTDEILKLK